MAQVTVTAQYVADTTAYVRNLRQATDATNQFARELPQVEQAQDKVKTSSIALGAALGTLGAQMFAKATGAVMRYAQQGIAAAKQYEQTVISIEGIFAGTGMSMEAAAEKTQSYLADLRDFAAKTPFELPQTLDAVKRLLSIGYAADDVKERLLPTIGDIVAALGQPPSAISAVVYAFGQMKSAGRVLSQDLMQIGNALPGFNAKMAIANEMFQGDFGAMTKAMESGALESSQAIDVIITAMQKFGGASGAMARQSETLAGVMSTFSDTVNNALIDGLMPSLPALSKTLNDVMPAVESMATAFAQALGPALIQGAAVMGQLAPTISAVVPPIINMVAQLTVMADVVVALSPMLEFLADIVGALANVLGMLPSPVYAAIGSLLLMRMAAKKLGLEAAMSARQISISWASMATGAKVTAGAVLVSFTNMRVGMEMAKLAAVKLAAGFKAAMLAMGAAVKGFLASIGPIGWVIMAAGAAFEIFAGRSSAAKARVDEMSASLDVLTGKLNETGRAALMKTLLGEISREDWEALDQLGLGLDEALAAIEGGEAAMNAYIDKVNENSTALVNMGVNTQAVANNIWDWGTATQQAASDAEYARQVQENAARSAWSAADAYKDSGEAGWSAADAYKGMSSTADAYSTAAQQAYVKTQSFTLATNAAKTAVTALTEATKTMSEAISAEATYDKARKGIMTLTEELKKGDKDIKGFSKAALDNRAAIRDAAQGYIDYANSLSDPEEKQAAIEEGVKRITKAMKEAGIDPSQSKILKTMREEAKQSKLTVDEFAKQRDVAEKYGNDVGKNFIDGIIEQLEADKKKVNTAAASVTSGMVDAANDAQQASSPAKATMKVAKNFIDGIIVGVKRDQKLAEMEVSKLGEGMISALETKLGEFSQKIQSAGAAFGTMRGALRQPFGEPSDIMRSFGREGNVSSAIGTFDQLDAAIREAYQPFLDAELVGKKRANKARGAMERARADLERMTAESIQLMRDRQAAVDRMDQIRVDTEEQIKAINAKYDALDASAEANIKSIESKWNGIIPGLERALAAANEAFDRENRVLDDMIRERDQFLNRIGDGLKSFANNLAGVTKKVTKVTKDLGNGITLTTEVETADASSFRANLESRLQSIREFTTNIRTLLARGLDPSLVQEFVSAGVGSSGDTVAALAGAADSELAAINAAQSSLSAEIASFQETANAQWYQAGIAQQEAVVAPLRAAADAAARALSDAQAARDSELAAAKAHAESLRTLRENEIRAAEAARDSELLKLKKQVDDANIELGKRADAMQKYFTDLMDPETGLPSKMTKLGKQVINGIIAGLKDREDALYAKARAIADTIRSEIAMALQVSSPSRVMETIGEQIADGLIVGMQSSERAVERAAQSLADRVMVPVQAPNLAGISAAPTMGLGATAGYGGSVTVHNKYEVNVQSLAGDKRQIGREVVEAIRAFERSAGPVYQPASVL